MPPENAATQRDDVEGLDDEAKPGVEQGGSRSATREAAGSVEKWQAVRALTEAAAAEKGKERTAADVAATAAKAAAAAEPDDATLAAQAADAEAAAREASKVAEEADGKARRAATHERIARVKASLPYSPSITIIAATLGR